MAKQDTAAGRALARVPEPVRSDPEFIACHTAREARAALSRGAQASYRNGQRWLIIASTAAALVGGLLLYGFDPPTADADAPTSALLRTWLAQDQVRIALGLLQSAALAGVAWGAHLQRRLRTNFTWLEHRLEAEKGRIACAMTALRIGYRHGPESFRAAGVFAVRDLLDDQLIYFDKARALHAVRAQRLLKVGGGIAAAGAAFAALQGLGIAELLLAAALVGVLSPALNSAVTTWESVSGDAERARSSLAAWFALTEVSGRRAAFEAALAENDLDAAEAWLEQVAEVLRADHAVFEALHKAEVGQG